MSGGSPQNGSGSLGSSAAAADAVVDAPSVAVVDASVQELLRVLITKLQQSGGSIEAVLAQAASAASSHAAPADAAARAVEEQSRLARLGEGAAAFVLPPRSVAASVSSAHSAASAATARTPIMRHTYQDDSKPFVVPVDKASKAPELQDTQHFATWCIAFTNFLAVYGISDVALRLPRYISLPTSVEQLTPGEQQGPAGYELLASAAAAAAGDASIAEKAVTEYDKNMFVFQALIYAVQKVPLAVSVVAGVPSPNAYEAWRRLREMFNPQTDAQLDIAEQEFALLKQGNDESIGSYSARAQLVFNSLALLQAPRSVHQQCSAFVRGIVSLSQTRRDMLNLFPKSSFESTVAMARQFEQQDLVLQRQQRGRQQQGGAAANMADSSNGRPRRDYSNTECHTCHKLGHISRHCPQKPAGSSEISCDWCGMRGHVEANCFSKKQGKPKAAGQNAANGKGKQASFAQNGGADGSSGSVVAHLFERVSPAPEALAHAHAAIATNPDPYALADSGANEHVLRDLPLPAANSAAAGSAGVDSHFPAAGATVPIRTAGGQIIYAQQAGNVSLRLSNGASLQLKSALHHPQAARNLLSVFKLIEQYGAQGFWFTREDASLIGKDGQTLLHAQQRNGVYAFELADSGSVGFAGLGSAGEPAVSIKVWHDRLIHASATLLNRLIKGNSLSGFSPSQATTAAELDCEACRLGKQPHSSHGSSVPAEHRSTRALERVDWDYFGPVSARSLGGNTGGLVGIDRFTDYAWVFLVSSRQQIPDKIIEWAKQMRNKFGHFPVTLHSDNALEFAAGKLATFCHENGIRQSFSPPYDPALNGGAERFNRTLIEASTTVMLRAGAPSCLWGEAVLTAAYVYNLIRTREGDDLRTAEQRLSGASTAPRVSHLRPFGCTAYVRLEATEVPGKFDAVARKMVFVGYADVGAWRFIDPSSATVTISRHARFAEGDFSAMAEFKKEIRDSELDGDDENDVDYYGRIAEKNEIELAKRFSLEEAKERPINPAGAAAAPAEPAVAVPDGADHPIPAGVVPAEKPRRNQRNKGAAPSRRSERNRKPAFSLGMVSPGDIGQAVLAEVCAFEVESTSTAGVSAPSLPSDPRNWREAMARPAKEAEEWRAGMRREEESLIEKGVFTVVDSLPPGAKCVGAKLVFKTKTDGDGRPLAENSRKVRLTAMGNEQRAGIDYGETFSSAMSLTSLRILVRIAAHHKMRIGHIDVSTAYLNAKLDRVIYMKAPPGMFSARPGQFLKLVCALYGLHQSGRLWAELLIATLESLGFAICENGDPYVLVRRSRSGRMLYIGVYVDDMPTLAHPEDEAEMEEVIQQLGKHFKITCTPDVHTLLGMRIQRDPSTGSFTMHQKAFVEKALVEFGMATCNSTRTPEAPRAGSTSSVGEEPTAAGESENSSASVASGGGEQGRSLVTAANFRALVGTLFWLANGTRYDIAHAVNQLARCVESPDENALSAGRRVLRYLSGTRSQGLLYRAGNGGDLVLEAFSDSDYAGDESTSKSTTGGLLKLGGAPIHWLSKQQSTVSRSSTEAEYVAAGECGRLIIWLRVLLAELGCAQSLPTPLRIDNETAIAMVTDDGRQFPRRKHIRVVYHWIREAAKDGFLSPLWVPTDKQEADLLTKALGPLVFLRLCQLIAQESPSDS